MALRGTCTGCGRIGATRRDGKMWAHMCHGPEYSNPPARDIQTDEYRVDVFVRAMLPNGPECDVRAAKQLVREAFGMPVSADAVDPVATK